MTQLKKLLMELRICDTETVFIFLKVKIYYNGKFLKKWLSLTSFTEIRRSVSVPLKFPCLIGKEKRNSS